MKQKTILFFGVVGAGKGTQVDLLTEYFEQQGDRVIYIYPGNEFRTLSQTDSFTSQRVESILEQGKLVPDFFTNALSTKIMQENFTGDEHVIFDGYPRSVNQSEIIEAMIEFFDMSEPVALLLNISEEEAVKRLELRGRNDDTPEGIASRINVYRDQVVPSLEYLKEKIGMKVYEINGEQTVEEVHIDIKKALKLK